MAEEIESPSAKKRRIIHWNPDAGREQERRRWTWKRILAWSVGGFFGLLLAAGILIRAAKLVFGPEIFGGRAEVVAGAPNVSDATSEFVTQAKAGQARELAEKSLRELSKIPTDHPSQHDHLVLMQKNFNEGEIAFTNHNYARAFAVFEVLNKEIEAYSQNVKAMGEAKKGYDAILVRIRELELARSLAPGRLEAAFEAASVGRQLLNAGNFSGAKRVFDDGFAALKQAENALADFVHDNLVRGQRALAHGEKEEAKQAFQAALEKAPGNEVANKGLKRAENIDRVYALLQQGERLEKESRFADAAESYKKAFALDSFSAAAQEGQSRAARLEKETKFATAKTAADAAFKAKEWPRAIAEYQNALKVYPNKKDVQSQLKLAKENAHKDAVQKSLAKGFAYEKAYQWLEARKAYEETLALEPDQADAKEGYTRAGTVIRHLLQYEKYIEAAEQLANNARFQDALRRFNDAMNVKPAYLEAGDRVMQLRALLQQQSQPVDIVFRSDGDTWVSIENFRSPKKFESEIIKMLPGDYQIIGRRKGYRDVHMTLQVRNGTPPPTVTVACNVSDRG